MLASRDDTDPSPAAGDGLGGLVGALMVRDPGLTLPEAREWTRRTLRALEPYIQPLVVKARLINGAAKGT